AVEGDIFHRTLSIDENSQFEGSSRRVENPTEQSSSADAKSPKKDAAPVPLPSIDAEVTDAPQHEGYQPANFSASLLYALLDNEQKNRDAQFASEDGRRAGADPIRDHPVHRLVIGVPRFLL